MNKLALLSYTIKPISHLKKLHRFIMFKHKRYMYVQRTEQYKRENLDLE